MSFENIRKTLKDLRTKSGLTQAALGDKMGMRQQDIAKIENDLKRRITEEEIYKYAKLFNVSSDYLLGLTDAHTNDKDIQFICDYTGLSEETIKALHYLETEKENSFVLKYGDTYNSTKFANRFIEYLFVSEEMKTALITCFNRLQQFIMYRNNGDKASIYLSEKVGLGLDFAKFLLSKTLIEEFETYGFELFEKKYFDPNLELSSWEECVDDE